MFALTFSFPGANAQQDSQPDLAFLEYLAELENVDGQWVDALDVATPTDLNAASSASPTDINQLKSSTQVPENSTVPTAQEPNGLPVEAKKQAKKEEQQ